MKSFLVLAILLLTNSVFAAKWNIINSPFGFNRITNSQMVTAFDLLPLNGKLDDERLGWSETYWPSNKGGIAYRWNHPDPRPFNYRFYPKEELQAMSEQQLSELSPSELYDIAQGDYRYSLTKKILSLYHARDLWWEGICHGWSLAASNYPEPDQVVVRNPEGIRVPFGSSDVKALLAAHDAYNSNGEYARVGDRCHARGKVPGEASVRDGYAPMPGPAEADVAECADMNAGSFHIVITNMIGIHSKGIVADVDRFNDVWNQPIVSYESSVEEEVAVDDKNRAEGIERKIKISLKMVFGEELQFFSQEAVDRGEMNFVSKLPVTRTPHQMFKFRSYEYILELDGVGNIIGGEWISVTRPDFMWIKKRDAQFVDGILPLAGLSRIYRPVRY